MPHLNGRFYSCRDKAEVNCFSLVCVEIHSLKTPFLNAERIWVGKTIWKSLKCFQLDSHTQFYIEIILLQQTFLSETEQKLFSSILETDKLSWFSICQGVGLGWVGFGLRAVNQI